ncbi:MAG TPA: MFS transporter [Rhizomicrobium sp.]|nr:MFS transporter [Rhizomicrobium sp.]
MASQIYSIGAILLSTAFLLLGYGLTNTLVPLRAHLEGFSQLEIGLLGSFYYGGFVIGCFLMPKLLARVGHIRSFAVMASLTAATVLIHPIIVNPFVWLVVRAAFGFCAAGVYMVIESWLNDRATNDNRGRILSAYVAVNLGSIMLGQWLLPIASPKGPELFSLAAVLYALCVVPVGMTLLPQPSAQAAPKLRVRRMIQRSPVGIAGVTAVGLANGAFWTLGPVYAISLGFSTTGIATFMSAFVLGGTLIQLPLGRLSDHFDRRWIIAAVSAAAALGGVALALLGRSGAHVPWLLYPLALFFGAAMLPLYSLSIAHANDRLDRSEFLEASATLLMVNALASVAGPTLAAIVTAATGMSSLFLYTAGVHTLMVAFTLSRMVVVRPSREADREQFVVMPQQSSAGAVELDPRSHEGSLVGQSEAA